MFSFSGLAAAYKLKVHGVNVTVYEADGRAGGKLQSISQGGLIWDEGANTMVRLVIILIISGDDANYIFNLFID